MTFKKKRKSLLGVEKLGCQSPGMLKGVSMPKIEARVTETDQGEDTVPMQWHSLGAFRLKNVSVHRADLSVVLKPQGGQVAAVQESGVGISAQDEKWMLNCGG